MSEYAARADRRATLTCPRCSRQSPAEMPEDACLWFFECPGCGGLLRPKPGDCCVFCSWGDRPCPPIERARAAAEPGGGCGCAG